MKARLASSLLVLALALAASIAQAQTVYGDNGVSARVGYSIPQNDPNIVYGTEGGPLVPEGEGPRLGVGASTTAGSDSHTIIVRWEAYLSYDGLGLLPPDEVTVTYDLFNRANAEVSLEGGSPPQGGGHAHGEVDNALAQTGSIARTSATTSSAVAAGPLHRQNKTVSGHVDWVRLPGTTAYEGTLILETVTQTTYTTITGGSSSSFDTSDSARASASQGCIMKGVSNW